MLATSRVINDSYSDGPTVQIWLLSVGSGHFHAIPNTQPSSTPGRAVPLAWNQDGSELYFEHLSNDGAHINVYRIHPDGSGKANVTPAVPQSRTEFLAVQPG